MVTFSLRNIVELEAGLPDINFMCLFYYVLIHVMFRYAVYNIDTFG